MSKKRSKRANVAPQKLLARNSYKLIGGNSMDVLETVRLNNSGPLVVVLYTSVYPQIKHQCLRTGANYVLHKSNEFDLIPELPSSRCSNDTPNAN